MDLLNHGGALAKLDVQGVAKRRIGELPIVLKHVSDGQRRVDDQNQPFGRERDSTCFSECCGCSI